MEQNPLSERTNILAELNIQEFNLVHSNFKTTEITQQACIILQKQLISPLQKQQKLVH